MNQPNIHEEHASLNRDFGEQDCPAELHGTIKALRALRRRILTNTFLLGLTKWWTWILGAVIVIGAISAKLAGAMILAAILAVAGGAFIFAWIFRTRLSIYETACRLDSAASLHDRVSTAIFLADIKYPDEIVQYQRRDALARLGKVEPRGLFPVRMPATLGWAVLLLFTAAGLFAYRLHHKPPLVALLQSTARSQLVQSILSPLARSLENDLQRTVAQAGSKPELPADEVRPGDPLASGDDLWQKGDDKGNNVEDEQDAVTLAQPSDQMQPAGDQDADPGDDAAQQANGQQPPLDANASQNPGNSGDPKPGDSSQSMSQSLMQALKNMMSNPPGQQQPSGRPSQPPQPNAQAMPQSGDSHQPGNTPDDSKTDSRGRSDAQQKSSEKSSSGAGNQAGNKELRTDLESHQVKAVPDRVALAPSGFKDPTRVRNATETGTAGMATGNASPQAVTAINGAELEDIPARYRLYVQHYFQHADKSDTDTGQQ